MFEQEIKTYETLRQEYQQRVAGRMDRREWTVDDTRQLREQGTAISRMRDEMAQKRTRTLPLIFF